MSRFALSRRSALALMGGAATFGLTGRLAHAAGEIKVLNWQGYGTDEKWALEMFEKKTSVKVVHDYFNSEQEMLTKLRTSPGTYDVVLMNNIYVMEAAHEGLVQALDTSKFSNFNDLTPSLRDSDRFVMDGKHYAISWVWGLTSFAYNTQKIAAKPDTMEALWDPAHAGKHPELRDKVIVPDVLIQAHSASLGMAFYDGKMFPAEYSGDAFVAEHGSWNHSQGAGREVIRIPLDKGRATGAYQDFLTGFTTDGRAWGRPVGVAVAADGSLLVTDDGARVIWRVSYRGK